MSYFSLSLMLQTFKLHCLLLTGLLALLQNLQVTPEALSTIPLIYLLTLSWCRLGINVIFFLSLMLWTFKLFVPVRCFQPNLSNVSKARSSSTCVGLCTTIFFINDALKYKLFFLNRCFRTWPIFAVEATNIHLSVLHLGRHLHCDSRLF